MAALKPRIVVVGHNNMENDEWRARDRTNSQIHFGFRGSRRKNCDRHRTLRRHAVSISGMAQPRSSLGFSNCSKEVKEGNATPRCFLTTE